MFIYILHLVSPLLLNCVVFFPFYLFSEFTSSYRNHDILNQICTLNRFLSWLEIKWEKIISNYLKKQNFISFWNFPSMLIADSKKTFHEILLSREIILASLIVAVSRNCGTFKDAKMLFRNEKKILKKIELKTLN